jgi:hypothetical protein
MKNTFQFLTLAILSLIFLPNLLFGQLYEVSLDEKIQKSSLIVEGKVIESKCYRADDETIYTAHKIKVSALLKGEYLDEYLTITTWGGEIEGELQTWTHLLTLNKGERGIFFLEPTRVPAIKDMDYPESFDVYAASQGFVQFVQNDAKAWVGHEPFHTYSDIPSDLFAYIGRQTGQKMTLFGDGGDEKRSGIRYHFTDIGFQGNTVTFNIYVNSLIGNKKLYQSGIQLGYNSAFFGSNIASNGNLLMQDAGISLSSTYDLAQSNVTSNKVKIELLPVGSLSGLTEITPSEQLLAKGIITIQNLVADPGITYDIAEMQAMSKFYEGGLQQLFDTVVVEGDWRPFIQLVPTIDSIKPPSRRAGTGDIIIIYGHGFTNTQPANGRVQFSSADFGFISSAWVEPLENDYQIWSDTLIYVRVPSVGYSNFGTTVADNNYAGTGKVRVKIGSMTSNQKDLNVRFCARNLAAQSSLTGKWYRIKDKLRNLNNAGGYDLYYASGFSLLASGAKTAFEKALLEWKCKTKVNFRLVPSFDSIPAGLQQYACGIRAGDLPPGIPSSMKAVTVLQIDNLCTTGPNDSVITAYYSYFDIYFKIGAGVTWRAYEDEAPLDWTNNELDIQSAALHELGHAHLLQHSNNNNDVMYYLQFKYKRVLEANDLEGGLYIMNLNKPDDGCSLPMTDGDCATSSAKPHQLIVTSIYPNPSSDWVFIDFPEILSSSIQKIQLTDLLGRVIFEDQEAKANPYLLSLKHLPNGTYSLIIKDKQGNSNTFKVIKQD